VTGATTFDPGAYWRPETLRDWIERTVAAAPDRPAVIMPGGALSYADLHRRALALAASFHSLGLRPGDVIAAQLPNSVEFMLTYLAAGYAGAVLQTIHMPYRAAEIGPLLQHSGAAALVCLAHAKDFSPAETVLALRADLPSLREVIAVGADAPAGTVSFPRAEAGDQFDLPTRPTAADQFLLLYTSGTVALPKGVPVPYCNFLANARLSAPELEIGPSSILLSAAPFTHLYGLFSLNLAFAAGATTALLPAFTPTGLASALETLRPTGVFTAPAHMAACLGENLLTTERLSGVRFVMISGSVCPPELARRVHDLMANGTVLQLWGMSELQAGTFTRPTDPLEDRLGSAGRASLGTELRVVDDDAPAPAGQEGELQVRGCSVFSGYLGNADATGSAFTADGWFRTGDLATLDARGNLRITGRLKELINRGGVKFNPTDVEAVIDRHPAVAQSAIVPMPDPTLGERACCFAVLRNDAVLDLEALRAWLAEHSIAKLKWPERLEIIAEMPLTPTRKIKKQELAARIAGRGST
jgi:cyclohexanecarboxylate-CoA ligase